MLALAASLNECTFQGSAVYGQRGHVTAQAPPQGCRGASGTVPESKLGLEVARSAGVFWVVAGRLA